MSNEKTVKHLLDQAGVLVKAKELVKINYESRLAPNFSPIVLFNLHETDLSSVIAYFLDPKAAHAQGSLFLRYFCKAVENQEFLDQSGRHPAAGFGSFSKETLVRTEYAVQEGRYDILLTDNKHAICIENKPWASDGNEQLLRYSHALKKDYPEWLLVYLSTQDPSEVSTGQSDEVLSHTVTLSYSELIDVFREALPKVQATSVATFLNFFIDYLREKILGETPMADESISKLVQENFMPAKLISEAYEQVSEEAWKSFCAKLEDTCKNKYSEKLEFGHEPSIRTSRRRTHFSFKPSNRDWYIYFEKSDSCRLRSFYWGITVSGSVSSEERNRITEVLNEEMGRVTCTVDRWWPWWVWGQEKELAAGTPLSDFPRNLDQEACIDMMLSEDGGELAQIVWRNVDKVLSLIESGKI